MQAPLYWNWLAGHVVEAEQTPLVAWKPELQTMQKLWLKQLTQLDGQDWQSLEFESP